MKKETKRSRKNEWLRQFFRPTHKESDKLKLTIIFEVTGEASASCYAEQRKALLFRLLADSTTCLTEGEKEALEMSFYMQRGGESFSIEELAAYQVIKGHLASYL